MTKSVILQFAEKILGGVKEDALGDRKLESVERQENKSFSLFRHKKAEMITGTTAVLGIAGIGYALTNLLGVKKDWTLKGILHSLSKEATTFDISGVGKELRSVASKIPVVNWLVKPAEKVGGEVEHGVDKAKTWLSSPSIPSLSPDTSIPTNALPVKSAPISRPSERVDSYLTEASKISGVDKAVLLAIAHQESHFKTGAVSGIGAIGLLQITPGTWRQMVSRYGSQLGIRQSDIRNPRANAIIGALYVREVMNGLKKFLHRKPSVTDIYAGYFLGPTGVKTLLSAISANPYMDAVKLMPTAARDNPGIFFRGGRDLSVMDVYQTLYGKVGIPYLKFSQMEGTPSNYLASSFSPPSGSTAAPVASKVSAPTTQAQVVAFSAPPKPVKARTMVASATDEGGSSGLIPISGTQTPVESNLIRDGRGRLFEVSLPEGAS